MKDYSTDIVTTALAIMAVLVAIWWRVEVHVAGAGGRSIDKGDLTRPPGCNC